MLFAVWNMDTATEKHDAVELMSCVYSDWQDRTQTPIFWRPVGNGECKSNATDGVALVRIQIELSVSP